MNINLNVILFLKYALFLSLSIEDLIGQLTCLNGSTNIATETEVHCSCVLGMCIGYVLYKDTK